MIGRMRYRVELQQQTLTRNAFGEPVPTWTTQITVPAAIKQQGGSELIRAGQQQTQRVYLVTIRAYSGLDATWRLLWGSTVLEIDSVTDEDGQGVWYVLACRVQG